MDSSVTICGEVKNPQRRIFESGMGLIEALTSSGWMLETHWKNVIIIRDGLSNPKFYKVDVDGILAGKRRNVALRAGDIVYVPRDNLAEYNVFVRKLLPTAQIIHRGVLAGVDPSFVNLDEEQPDIVERINAARPGILFVALGNPKQELWMGRNLKKLRVGVAIGVGGTFNFVAGRVRRAPLWMQRCGMEWIYRIVQEPGRLWRRYAYGLVKYSWLSLIHLLGGYREGSQAGSWT